MYYIPCSLSVVSAFTSVGWPCRLTFLAAFTSASSISRTRLLRTASYAFSFPFNTFFYSTASAVDTVFPKVGVSPVIEDHDCARSSFVRLYPISDACWILVAPFELHNVSSHGIHITSHSKFQTKPICPGLHTSLSSPSCTRTGDVLLCMSSTMDHFRGSSITPRIPHSLSATLRLVSTLVIFFSALWD
ncbi:hypothetical protein EJ02DRAFT_216505 [Clathrospora elynae]|uniref:Uncharacterized protein n=1 Tax=Clathrospora elynae TaxID=706981 RepID=A0A6A5TCL0_9PLEO|nr:hypothetical protein EJ02DRAFT_216505 [Clathrospora elynae]